MPFALLRLCHFRVGGVLDARVCYPLPPTIIRIRLALGQLATRPHYRYRATRHAYRLLDAYPDAVCYARWHSLYSNANVAPLPLRFCRTAPHWQHLLDGRLRRSPHSCRVPLWLDAPTRTNAFIGGSVPAAPADRFTATLATPHRPRRCWHYDLTRIHHHHHCILIRAIPLTDMILYAVPYNTALGLWIHYWFNTVCSPPSSGTF